MVSVIGLLDFDGCAVVELAVESLVVPPPHVLQIGQLDLFDGAPGSSAADQFGLLQTVDRLGERVVERVADRAS